MRENNRRRLDLDLIADAALQAGRVALPFFNNQNQVWKKQGDSPVSEADIAVDRFLHERLLGARPDYGWLSEETTDDRQRLVSNSVFVVDPIDGTRGFIAGDARWCISVAVVEERMPVCAVLVFPALDCAYTAYLGGGSKKDGRSLTIDGGSAISRVAGPRRWLSDAAQLTGLTLEIVPFIPSLAYRIAMVADGSLDAALAKGGAYDWDIAAADLIVSEAGGRVSDDNGEKIRYNEDHPQHGLLVAAGGGRIELAIALAQSTGIIH